MGTCKLKPTVSQGTDNVQPWAGPWNNFSPHSGLEEGLTSGQAAEEGGSEGRRISVVSGQRAWGRRSLQELGSRQWSSGKAVEICPDSLD